MFRKENSIHFQGTCPTTLIFREIEDRMSGGRSPPGKQRVWGAAGHPMSGLGLFLLTSNFGRHRSSFFFLNCWLPGIVFCCFLSFFVGSARTVYYTIRHETKRYILGVYHGDKTRWQGSQNELVFSRPHSERSALFAKHWLLDCNGEVTRKT